MGGKMQKSSKIPCYFPCSQGIGRHREGNRDKTCGSQFIIAGLVPAMTIRKAQCPNYRDGPRTKSGGDKPGHDQIGIAMSFAPLLAPLRSPPLPSPPLTPPMPLTPPSLPPW